MAGIPNLLDPQSLFAFANTQTAGGWLSMGINLILSTIVGGIVLIILAEVFSHLFKESIKPQNAFLVSLLGNIINLVVLMFATSYIPYGAIIIPLAIWFVLMKMFFHEMKIVHALIVAVIFYFLTIMMIPYLVAMVSAYIPVGI
jgi:hypothetical protein